MNSNHSNSAHTLPSDFYLSDQPAAAKLDAEAIRAHIKAHRQPDAPPKNKPLFAFRKRISESAITQLLAQLGSMIKVGVPIVSAFDLLASDSDKKGSKLLVEAMRQNITEGHSLAKTLGRYPDHFDRLLCSLVDIGEQTGNLDQMLERLAEYRERSARLKKQIWSALTYPIIVMLIAIAITSFMLVKIIPQFEVLFASFNSELPAFTRLVIELSRLLQNYGLVILASVGLILVCCRQAYKRNQFIRLKWDSLLLGIPLLGQLIRKSILVRYAHTLAFAMDSGDSVLLSLQTLAGNSGNSFYNQALQRVVQEVQNGQSLYLAMSASKAFSPLMLKSVAVGEESGTLAKMMHKLVDLYEAEMAALSKLLINLLEPLAMCILALLTGGLIIAIYLPIFNLGGVIGGVP